VPIKAKYMVIGYAVIEFFLGVTPSLSGTIAHFAHLGGMFFGLILILYWQKKGTLGRRYF
jgi:membrane associated rhomboid family serine protease